MTKSEIDRLDWSLVGPGLLILNQYFDCIFPEIWLLWFTLFWAAIDLYFYCQGVSIWCILYKEKIYNTNLF